MTTLSLTNDTFKSLTRNWGYYSNFYLYIAFSNGKAYWKYVQMKISPNFFPEGNMN